MQIKINNELINAEILPLVDETKDESLDIFSFSLLVSGIANPLAPYQKVQIITDNNETLNFVISSDSVEMASLNPVMYKHNIHCTQNTNELKTHLVRNSNFSQPPNVWETFNQPHSYCLGYSEENTSLPSSINRYHAPLSLSAFSYQSESSYLEKVTMSSRKKAARCYLNVDLRIAEKMQSGSVGDGTTRWFYPKTRTDLLDEFSGFQYSTISVQETLRLSYYQRNGTSVSIDATPQQLFGKSELQFNQEIESPLLTQLLNEGCYNIYIDTSSGHRLITADQYAVTETKSIVFYTVNFKFKVETYYYSCFDILQLLINRQKQVYNDQSREDLFKLPSSGDLYDLLTKTIAPNYVFTQNTMYECVAEVFRLFDAIFTMDSDGYLGIEYFNDRNATELPNNTKLVGANLSLGENRFTNRLISYYQNAKQEITHPSKQSFAHLRTNKLGVPDNNSFSYVVEHPIDQIINCEVLLQEVRITCGWGSSASTGFVTQVFVTGDFVLDISHYVVNEQLWGTLSQVYNESDLKVNPYTLCQANTLSFKDTTIDVFNTFTFSNGVNFYSIRAVLLCAYWWQLGLTGAGTQGTLNDISIFYIVDPNNQWSITTAPDYENIRMRVTYIATLDGRVVSESASYKYDGESLIDQYNGAVDLDKMGCNMLGINYKSGEPTLNVNQKVTTWANRIKKGQILKFENTEWIANVCSYTILQDGLYSGQISFVKNFNSLSLNTRIIREKRMSQISNELTQKSEDNIIEYVYYDVSPLGFNNDTLSIEPTKLLNGIVGSFDYLFSDKSSFDGVDTGVLTRNIESHPPQWIYMPLNKYSNGNGICYEVTFNSPIIAGYKTRKVSSSDVWFGSDKWFTDYVRYADTDGFMDVASIGFFRKASSNTSVWSVEEDYFPYLNDDFNSKPITIRNYAVYKQPNEVFALNYQLAFIPQNETDVFFYPRFFKESLFIDKKYCDRNVYVVTTQEKFSIFDLRADTSLTLYDVNDISIGNSNNIIVSTSQNFNLYNDGGVAIVDKEYNILFAYNNKNNGTSNHINIYFGFKRIRGKLPQVSRMLNFTFNNEQIQQVVVTLNGQEQIITNSRSFFVSEGDTYSWIATSKRGYHITSNRYGSGTISQSSVNVDIESRASQYQLNGESDNGTVTFYTGIDYNPITTATYGQLVWYRITANTGYNVPTPSAGYVNVNDNDFQINDIEETAYKLFPDCRVKTYPFYIETQNGTVSGAIHNTTEAGTQVEINVGNNQSKNYDVEHGGYVTFTFTPISNDYYYDGQTTFTYDNITTNLPGNQGTGIFKFYAIKYHTITINPTNTGVASVDLTINGVTTNYPRSGGIQQIKVKAGLSYSWTAYASTGYTINTGGSGSGTTSAGGTTSIVPTAVASLYTVTFSMSSQITNVLISWTLNGSTQTKTVHNGTTVTNVPYGSTYSWSWLTNENLNATTTTRAYKFSNLSGSGTITGNTTITLNDIGIRAVASYTFRRLENVGMVVSNGRVFYNGTYVNVNYNSTSQSFAAQTNITDFSFVFGATTGSSSYCILEIQANVGDTSHFNDYIYTSAEIYNRDLDSLQYRLASKDLNGFYHLIFFVPRT